MKIHQHSAGHITKMAAMSIFGISLRVPTHIEVYFFIKRLRHTDAHFFFVIICLNYLIIYIL